MTTTSPTATGLALPGLCINGRPAAAADTFEVINPATGQPVGSAPATSADQVEAAFEGALNSLPEWSRDLENRRRVLSALADASERHADELAVLLSLETGKPLKDARWEGRLAANFYRYYAEVEIEKESSLGPDGYRSTVSHRPLGVVVNIHPWNYPINNLAMKLAPALRAGNTVLIKPSSSSPFSGLRWAEIISDIVPDGVVNILSGPEPLGANLSTDPRTRKVSFTGSTRVGMKLYGAVAPDIKRLTLELGGNDPAVVLPGAQIEAVADGIYGSAFINNGQVCAAIKRVYVHESQAEELAQALARRAAAATVGDPFDEMTDLGPLTTAAQRRIVSDLVQDAVASGARVLTGGHAIEGKAGYFYSPTIVDRIDPQAALVQEEQFGPALPVVAYRDLDQALAWANGTPYGLGASVWGEDLARAAALAVSLDAGTVTVNRHGIGRPDIAFAGHGWSGLGVENGVRGFEEFTAIQAIGTPADLPPVFDDWKN
ncbi:aldehyde dehydrogenase family protein [Pseudarthrobacter sp. lyk4-40-TYG-27]|uniref:aldehyde dehydrogenase family protein n=1 Tax=Pseudarthrobacter sp. lyk4-40-TYG-27 TaxID=3040305 RepID=UPI002552F952|nr:aldehyde dehydrogenase family protein [Pseudarthrobacter sp. lyk4-40-TYG-27]